MRPIANGVNIFGIIDDFDEIYKETCPIGVDIIHELFHIGWSKMGVNTLDSLGKQQASEKASDW